MARTVLVIDDSSAFRTSARMLLRARGYDVVGVAEDIRSGVSVAHELRPDCVVMDINLPDGNGLDAARTLALDDGYAPAIVLVSTLDAGAVGDVEASGARGFVPKAELASPKLVELLGPP
jgi:DNA-binding NarL/FixJ family response regulator